MSEKDRNELIEWLYLITGVHRSYWEKMSDSALQNVYQLNVEENASRL